MADATHHFTVLGAGIVGMCCALHLQRDGHLVTVIDRLPPGEGTSSGNAGLIQVDSCVPIASPGILRDVPKMLLDPRGPLVIRWRYLLPLLPWLVRFVAAARPARVEAISMALADILSHALAGFAPLIRDAGAGDLFRETGVLYVYRSQAAYRSGLRDHDLRRRRGMRLDEVPADEIRQIEPALSPDIRHAIYAPDCQSIADPLTLTQRLAASFAADGGTIVHDNVTAIEVGADGPLRLVAEAGSHPVDRLVIAAGAYSRPWAAQFGARVPLDTERGYHMMLPDPGVDIRLPIIAGDRKFGIVPLTGGVRLAGTAEFAGLAAPPYYRRADILVPLARQIVPGLNAAGATPWMGYRPATPDSLPVIGRSPRFDSVYFAFGHGHLGLTLGGVTGALIADLAAGREPAMDLAPYRPDRF